GSDYPPSPGVWGGEPTPYALHCRYVDNVHMHHVQVDWQQAAGCWQHQMMLERVTNARIADFTSRNSTDHLAETDILVRDSHAVTCLSSDVAVHSARTVLS
ncbi:MAG TPA: hypothetical protein VHV83_19985, partial [Armatimonadota bacterium]|nr:hypothetical protein [Armatimonadota bacterium]